MMTHVSEMMLTGKEIILADGTVLIQIYFKKKSMVAPLDLISGVDVRKGNVGPKQVKTERLFLTHRIYIFPPGTRPVFSDFSGKSRRALESSQVWRVLMPCISST